MNTDIKFKADENSESMENKNNNKNFNIGDIVVVYKHYNAFVVCNKPEIGVYEVVICGIPNTKYCIPHDDTEFACGSTNDKSKF